MLSKRMLTACDDNSFLVREFANQQKNAYNITCNPTGIINLGTAENKLVYDIVRKKLNNISNMPDSYAHYNNFAGVPEFRKNIANFINYHMKASISLKLENVLVTNGCGPAVEFLAYSLCDANEGILTPAPYYGAFESDMRQRVSTKLYPVNVPSDAQSDRAYKLTTNDLEQAMKNAKRDGVIIRALLISNPYNPIGTIYTLSEMKSYAEFCYQKNIHLISDEIYYFSVFDKEAKMKSVLSLTNFSKYTDIIHVLWGFSKDFGLSGFRCGTILTYNKNLAFAFNQISMFSSIPTETQYLLESLITDFDWLHQCTKINSKRLREASNKVTKVFDEYKIPYIKPVAGLFIWFNLKKYLDAETEAGEKVLFNRFMENGVYIAPGLAFGSTEYGWFRIVFSTEIKNLEVAMERFTGIISEMLNNNSSSLESKEICCPKLLSNGEMNGNVHSI